MSRITLSYDTDSKNIMFMSDETVTPEEGVNFLIEAGKGLLTLPFITHVTETKPEEFVKKFTKIIDDGPTQVQIKIKELPFISALQAWTNAPKGIV